MVSTGTKTAADAARLLTRLEEISQIHAVIAILVTLALVMLLLQQLRTPLAAVRAYAELFDRGARERRSAGIRLEHRRNLGRIGHEGPCGKINQRHREPP